MKYDFNDFWTRLWHAWSDVCSDIKNEVSDEIATAVTAATIKLKVDLEVDLTTDLNITAVDLKIIVVHVINDVIDEMSDEAAFNAATFNEESAFNVNEADAIWKLMMTDKEIFDEAAFDINAAFVAAFNVNINSLFIFSADKVLNFATEATLCFALKTFAVLLMLFFKT